VFLQLIQAGKGEALRIRAILRSLVLIEDLVGVISLSLQIPSFGKGKEEPCRHMDHVHNLEHVKDWNI
jgi:hypothetical protein